MDVALPSKYSSLFTSNGVAMNSQPVANGVLMVDTSIAVNNWVLPEDRRLLSLMVCGMTVLDGSIVIMSSHSLLKLHLVWKGSPVKIADSTATAETELLYLSDSAKANFFPGFVCDSLNPDYAAVQLAFTNLATWVPAGAVTFSFSIIMEYYKESEYQKYLRLLDQNDQNIFG